MAAFSQTTLSNAFSWMKILEFRLKNHWSLFLRVLSTIFHQCWLDHWRIYASLGLNDLNRIFLNENVRISIKISLKFAPKGPINNIPALVQIMAWRRPGDKPLSEPTMVSLLTHICVTRPQWFKDGSLMGQFWNHCGRNQHILDTHAQFDSQSALWFHWLRSPIRNMPYNLRNMFKYLKVFLKVFAEKKWKCCPIAPNLKQQSNYRNACHISFCHTAFCLQSLGWETYWYVVVKCLTVAVVNSWVPHACRMRFHPHISDAIDAQRCGRHSYIIAWVK